MTMQTNSYLEYVAFLPPPPPPPPLPHPIIMWSTANRNTIILLLLLFLAVLISVVVIHHREKNASYYTHPPPPPTTTATHVAPPPDIAPPPPAAAAPPAHGTAPPPTHAGSQPPSPPRASPPPPPREPPAWVPDAVVAADGSGNYTSVADAVDAAPSHNRKRFVIRVKAGVYRENVKVTEDKVNLVLLGDGMARTVLTSNRSADRGWTTSYTATLAVMGDGFMAQDLTIENTAGPGAAQAVALRSNSDRSVLYRCAVAGFQDTLYAKRGRQLYRECDVYGTVDFVFGDAAAVLQNCNLYSRRPLLNHTSTFTAHGRNSSSSPTGFSLHNCTIAASTSEPRGNGEGHPSPASAATRLSFLGRPWKEYSRTVVMQSFLGEVVDPLGWLAWNEGYESTLYYGEYANRGPGADTSRRVAWPGFRVINSSVEASLFTVSEFIDGDDWLPAMKVPYVGGLM